MKPSRLSTKALAGLMSVQAGQRIPLATFATLHKKDLVKATGASPKRVTLTPKGEAVLERHAYRRG